MPCYVVGVIPRSVFRNTRETCFAATERKVIMIITSPQSPVLGDPYENGRYWTSKTGIGNLTKTFGGLGSTCYDKSRKAGQQYGYTLMGDSPPAQDAVELDSSFPIPTAEQEAEMIDMGLLSDEIDFRFDDAWEYFIMTMYKRDLGTAIAVCRKKQRTGYINMRVYVINMVTEYQERLASRPSNFRPGS